MSHDCRRSASLLVCSKSLPRLFGVVVVATQPAIHTINVRSEIKPDPLLVKENDIVCWSFNGDKKHDVVQVSSLQQAVNIPRSRTVPPR